MMETRTSTLRRAVHRARLLAIVTALLGVNGRAVLAQQSTMPIRPLGAVIATFPESLGSSSSIRALSDGRVLVNDPAKRRLILLDSTLQHPVIVADTTSRTAKAYGDGLIGLTPFTGDSSLILDQLTGAFLVLDPMGKVGRIITVPGNARAPFGSPGFPLAYDHAGHLVFPAPPTIFLALLDREFVGDTLMRGPDSVAILRQNLATRRIDTIAMLQAPRVRQAVTRRANGGRGRAAVNPIQSADDWTLLNDGTVAVVRARDFHIDWIRPDGQATASPKLPAQWIRLTDSMKVAIMDSVRAHDLATGMGRDDGSLPLAQRRVYVEPSDLPDYQPPFTSGLTRADAEGNVWVRVNRPAPAAGGAVYDVINRNGELIDRVRIPSTVTLIGFGHGVAYVMSRAGATAGLSKAHIR